MTKAEMITQITAEVKGLSSYLVADDYDNACDDAARETGWAYPVATDFKEFWQKKRAIRALFFYLMSESAYKFKYKQINTQQRFDHLKSAIKMLDDEFKEIQEERPDQFADVSTFNMFGHKVDAGFAYEPQTGRDTTYESEQEVIVHPNENS